MGVISKDFKGILGVFGVIWAIFEQFGCYQGRKRLCDRFLEG